MKQIPLQLAAATGDYQLVLPVGKYATAKYGEIEFTEAYCQKVVENWKGKVLGNRAPFVDVDHERGEAQGWIVDMKSTPEGLMLKIDWTEPGRAKVEGGLYKYFSCDLARVKTLAGKDAFPVLVAVALTNTPVLNNLPEVHLSETNLTSAPPASKIAVNKPTDTDRKFKQGNQKMDFAQFLESLKGMVGEDGKGMTPEQISQICEVLGVKMPTEVPVEGEALAAPPAAVQAAAPAGEPDGDEKKMSERLSIVQEQLARLSAIVESDAAAKKSEKRAGAIAVALSEGKILPADKKKWEARFDKDPEFVADILATMPKNPAFVSAGHAGSGPTESGAEGKFSDNEKSEARKLGESLGWNEAQVATFISTGGRTIDSEKKA